MSKKQTLINKFNELRNRLALVATAGVLGLTGCAAPKQQNSVDTDDKNVNEIIQQIDEKIIENNDISEAENIIKDVELMLPKMRKNAEFRVEKKEGTHFFDTIQIFNYDGNSIEDALRLNGYGYSFAFREELANYFGIENYRGTAEQNIRLLNILRKNAVKTNDTMVNQEQGAVLQRTMVPSIDEEKVSEQIADAGNRMLDQTLPILDEKLSDMDETVAQEETQTENNEKEKPSRPSRPNHGGTGGGTSRPNPDDNNKDEDKKPEETNPDDDKNKDEDNKPGENNPDDDKNKDEDNKPGENNPDDDKDKDEDNKPGENNPDDDKDKDEDNKPGENNPDDDKDKDEDKKPGDDKPEESKPDEPHVTHVFGKWFNFDDNLEKRVCSCGESETRPHKKETVTTYTDNHNGTHNVLEVTTCVNCDYEVEKSIDESCDLKFDSYNALEETLLCSKCNATAPRPHKPIAGKPLENGDIPYTCGNEGCTWTDVKSPDVECNHDYQLSTTYAIKGNGVHEKTETSICSKCGDTIIETDEEVCSYDVESFTKDYENIVCEFCKDKTTRPHKPVAGEPLENGDIPYTCGNKGCTWTETKTQTPIHTDHDYKLVDWNEEEEILECQFDGCDKRITRAHQPVAGPADENGNLTYTCAHEGCTWTKESHIHQTRTRTEKVGTADVCTRKVTYCTIDSCGEIISVEDNTEHKWRISSEGEILGCRVCRYTPEPEKEEETEETKEVATKEESTSVSQTSEAPVETTTSNTDNHEDYADEIKPEFKPEDSLEGFVEENDNSEETVDSEDEKEAETSEPVKEEKSSSEQVEENETNDQDEEEPEETMDSVVEENTVSPDTKEENTSSQKEEKSPSDSEEEKASSKSKEEDAVASDWDEDFEILDIDNYDYFSSYDEKKEQEEKGRSRKLVLEEE